MKNEDVATSSIEQVTKRVPSVGFLGLAIGSIAVSATLMLLGKKTWANFVGQWAPTILILGTYNKLVKTFSAPINEEQRLQHGGHPSILKGSEDMNRQPRPLI
ncbi:hypothetical protein [Hyalangium sp.]|uniref:hypothetical protein n=1 Tax=Hyalangium sp. TaxID=2028555 RepID=UPI002D509FDA|nr:hypothetical protein [Hyalangium sp.]HYH97731.1 hypothetical protein [Hyalangium sp.]